MIDIFWVWHLIERGWDPPQTLPPPMTLRCWFLSVRIVLHSDLTSTLLNTISMKSYLPEPPPPAGFGSNAIT